MLDVSVVMFAIQGGVRLYGAVRRADADAKRSAGLVLPLPLADDPGIAAALHWFAREPEGRPWLDADTEVARIVGLTRPATPDEERWFLARYRTVRPLADGLDISGAEGIALLTVQQWAKNEDGAPRSPLQTVAGEVVNIAVDYFVSTPGAVSEKRPEGKALKAVLEALDDADFKDVDLSDAAGEIVLAVLGAVSKNPEVVSGGEKERLLVKSVTAALAASAKKHMGVAVAGQARLRAAEWLRLVGAAVLQGGVDAVAANQAVFLGDVADPAQPDAAKKTVLFDVTKTVADLLIGDKEMLTFRGLLSGDGLHSVVRSAVDSLAANPAVLGPDRRGLRTILLAVAKDVADRPGLPADLGPELARLVLEKTAANLDLVWPDAAKDDREKHLLLVATKSVLARLAQTDGGAWRPTFGKDELVGLLDVVLDEVVDHPAWLVGIAKDANDDLGVAVSAMVTALGKVPGSRIDGAAASAALRAALLAVADEHELLEKLPAGAQDEGKTALEAVVGAVVGTIFRKEASPAAGWKLARTSVVVAMIETALATAAKKGAPIERLQKLRDFVAAWVGAERAFDRETFARELGEALVAA